MKCYMCGEESTYRETKEINWDFHSGDYEGQRWSFGLCDECSDYIGEEIACMLQIEPDGFCL